MRANTAPTWQTADVGPGQLVARPDDSVDWDTTANWLIEGENLLALRLLRPSYASRVELAYLDPPYNLGRDVVYDDVPRADGEWSAMMAPRLELVRELLTPSGVVCISIDDQQIVALRLLCNEIFGAGNFVATFTWETKRAARGAPPRSRLMHNHEYVVCYAREHANVRFRGLDRDRADFANPDNDPRGPWRSESMKATGSWAFSRDRLERMIADGRVLFPDDPRATPRQKKFFDTYTNGTKAAVTSLGWHSTERATKALMDLFDGEKVFSFPKPLSLLEFFCDQLLGPGDIVLDPFAGSGTTGHAVRNVNAADDGDRTFVLIQRPEPLDERNPQQRSAAQFCDRIGRPRTIVELTKERLRRAGAGFRVYELIDD
jgi:adenine-specific DNA-methyltransferase